MTMTPRLTVIGAAMMLLAVMTMALTRLPRKSTRTSLGWKNAGLPVYPELGGTLGNTWMYLVLCGFVRFCHQPLDFMGFRGFIGITGGYPTVKQNQQKIMGSLDLFHLIVAPGQLCPIPVTFRGPTSPAPGQRPTFPPKRTRPHPAAPRAPGVAPQVWLPSWPRNSLRDRTQRAGGFLFANVDGRAWSN